jgi:hypothetical protein
VLSVAGTLGVTYFGYWLNLSKDKQLRQDELDRRARYLAIRVVCKLDPFVSECCEVVHDEGRPDGEGEMHPQLADPTLSFPEDVDWKSVEPDLMYRVLGFPNELDNANLYIKSTLDNIASRPDYSEYFEERILRYGQLGLTALALADEIRQTYNIPSQDFGKWHPKNMLEDAVAKAKREREESQAEPAKFMEEIVAKVTPGEEANPH